MILWSKADPLPKGMLDCGVLLCPIPLGRSPGVVRVFRGLSFETFRVSDLVLLTRCSRQRFGV